MKVSLPLSLRNSIGEKKKGRIGRNAKSSYIYPFGGGSGSWNDRWALYGGIEVVLMKTLKALFKSSTS